MDAGKSMSRRHESIKALARLRARIAALKERSDGKWEEMRDLQNRIDKLHADLAATRARQPDRDQSSGASDKRDRAE